MITRGGYDWTKRYPWIAEAARKNRIKQFVIDGEAVVLGVDGISDFNDLHSGKHDDEVQFCAFDILAEGGDDLRKVPLHLRKTSLDRLLARRPEGIFVNPFERGEIGPDLFQAACDMGLEGLVTKHWDRPYQGGRSKHWVKVKNRGASCDEPRDVKCAPAAGDFRDGHKEAQSHHGGRDRGLRAPSARPQQDSSRSCHWCHLCRAERKPHRRNCAVAACVSEQQPNCALGAPFKTS